MGKSFMARTIPKPHKRQSLFKGLSESVKARQDEQDRMFLVSFKDMDRTQGQTFAEWESEELLSKALETLRDYCCAPLLDQAGSKFTIYGSFPPDEKTDFTKPKHIPEDAQWARIHVAGEPCIIGHVVRNVFYVVFLDKKHKFYKSELKHT